MAIECFKIEWTKPFHLTEIGNRPEVNDSGVYARLIASGGTRKLNYIGKSTDFRRRSSEHRRHTTQSGSDIKKHYISLGIVYSFEGNRMRQGCTTKQLNAIESYLRNTIKPKGNDFSTMKGYSGLPIIIINTGTVPKPIQKIMCHSPELLSLLSKTIRPKRTSAWAFE